MDEWPTTDIGVVGDGDGGGRNLRRLRREDDRSDRRRGLLLAAMAIALAIAALVLIPLISSEGGGEAEEADETGVAEDRGLPLEPDRFSGEAPTPDPPVTTGFGFDPPSGAHLRADRVGEIFANEIDRDGRRFGIAYVSEGGLIVLDNRGVTSAAPRVAGDYATVSGLSGLFMLTSGGRTWAVDAHDRDQTYLVSNSYVVVESRRPGLIAIIDVNAPREVELMSAAMPIPGIELPTGADLLWVQGRGVLVLPRTGGTFEIEGPASGFVRTSPDRAVAASVGGTVYERCDEELHCRYVAERDGTFRDLPFESGAVMSVSPDGRWVAADTGEEVELYRMDGDGDDDDGDDGVGDRPVRIGASGAIAFNWAPDSSFLVLAYVDSLDVIWPESGQTVALAPNRPIESDSLLVFVAD